MKESILRTSLRYFSVCLFSILGILVAFSAMSLFYSLIGSSEEAISNDYTVKILPNADNVRKKESSSAPVILQINLNGLIGLESLSQKTVRDILMESREGTLKNDRVKAIFLHCNTPGGGMTDADGIYEALKEYKARYKTPVFVYVDGLLASGGMYIAAAADEIHASNVSLIGSIGVITPAFLNFSKIMDKVGVDSLTLYAGKGKDDMNPLRPWKPGEADSYKQIIDYYYQYFVNLVTTNRPQINKTQLVEELGANIFPADEALKYGLIDTAGATRESTLKKLLAKIGIEDNFYQVVELESTSWLSQLFKAESPLFTGTIKHEIRVQGELPPELSNQLLYLYQFNS